MTPYTDISWYRYQELGDVKICMKPHKPSPDLFQLAHHGDFNGLVVALASSVRGKKKTNKQKRARLTVAN